MSETPPEQETSNSVLAAGSRIGGDYQVDEVIKAGGMGEVYRAHNVHLGTPCAIKVVLPGLEADPLVKEAFLKEATTLQSLQHDAIVRYFNFTRDANLGRYCLIMEFVAGTPLSDFSAGTRLDVGNIMALMRRVAKGLSAAHRAGVVHRDLSPDNVILPDGAVTRAKIIDFGIAKTTKAGAGTLFQDKMVGKFGYMAPEQLGEFDARIGPHTDIYSLALVMAAVAQGKPLKMGTNYAEAFRARQAVPDLEGIPALLEPLLDWMLQPNPMDRPASMAQVIDGIDRITAENAAELSTPDEEDATVVQSLPPRDLTPRPVTARKPRPEPEPAPPPRKSKMGVVIPLAVVAVLAGGVGGFLVMNPDLNPLGTTDVAVAPEIPPEAIPPIPDPGVTSPDPQPEPEVEPEIQPDPVPPAPVPVVPDPEPEPIPEPEVEPEPVQPTSDSEPEAPTQPEAMEVDQVSTMLSWLNLYDTGACTYVAISNISESAVTLLAYGQDPAPFLTMIEAFRAEHGIEPDVTFQTITARQCPVLDYVNWQNSEGAPSTDLSLLDDTVDSGQQVRGRLSGLDGRTVWLTLVDPNGGMVSLERFLVRENDEEATFSIGLRLREGQQAAPHMIFALVSDDEMSFTAELQSGAPADQVLAAVRSRMLLSGASGSAVVRYFRLQ